MILTFAKKRWKLRRARLASDYGRCSDPSKPNKEIVVHKPLSGETELDTYIHEFLHACGWEFLDESWVGSTATDIARALYKLGYRKQQ